MQQTMQTNQINQEMNQEKNQPIRQFRAGAIAATIWENKTEKGAYNTVSFKRGYKDKQGNWKDTTSLRVMDLPKAALVLTKAYEYLSMTNEAAIA